MSTEVIMPQMGESIFEGTITKWLKKPGDAVQKDEPLFEISTDKVDAEIPSPVAGVLAEIKIAEGATAQVNTVVAVISDGAAVSPEAATTPARKPAPPQVAQPAAQPEQTTPLPVAPPPPYEPVPGGAAIVMPQLGESIFEGTITKWLKKPGDSVQKDEPLFEISTDKVDAEIPAPFSGTLSEIHVTEGSTVEVNTVVAIMSAAEAAGVRDTPRQKAAALQVAAAQTATQMVAATLAQKTGSPQAVGRIRSSPLARRIAREHGIELSRIAGSGSGSRIGKEDVLRAIKKGGAAAAPRPAGSHIEKPAAPQVAPAPDLASLPTELVPLTRMRAIIAERMVESVRISPHVHSVYKVDMTRIARLRDHHMAAFNQRHGVKLTYMPFIAASAVAALRRFPIVNASLENTASGLAIRYHREINLGIAVALDWGLIVPVIRNAEQRTFADIARSIADLALRARSKKLSPDEVGNSTFTLTNAGAFGGEYGLPIINQPESAILAVGGLRKEPAVLSDTEGNDTIAIRSMQHFCLGFDHRLIDGADAGKFMLEFKKVLESWNQEIA